MVIGRRQPRPPDRNQVPGRDDAFRFRQNGTFTIVQFTDLHWQNGGEDDRATRALMGRVLDAEAPDLVVLTGDVLGGSACADPAAAWREAVAPMEAREIPWCAVFGNHDDEGSLTRAQLMAAQQEFPMCRSLPGPENIGGVGNYAHRIYSASRGDSDGDAAKAVLYFLDSGGYAPEPVGGYAWITPGQIAWFRAAASAQASSGGSSAPPPSLVFFHIPLPEYAEVWDTRPCRGHRHEPVCCPALNSGLFTALLEAGGVLGTFVGHDHVNDFEGTLHGIRLCYGRATGYNTYGREGFARGARVIRLREDVPDFSTWLRLDDGSVVTDPPEHFPERRGDGSG